jgi:ATP-dependent RNA helicase DeaD
MSNFNELGLSQHMLGSLERLNFSTPTPIQAQTIPVALAGGDIMGSAQTGTGKTAAFGIPLVEKLLSSPQSSALVLTPTRELATQVMQTLQALLGKKFADKTALLIGGESIFKQLKRLRNAPLLIVATPGRLMDHVRRKTVSLHNASFVVLDETDRMLDMGFMIQIDEIMKHLPNERQTLLFSATIPKNIVKIAEKYLKSPVRIAVGNSFTPAAKVKQEMLQVSDADKYGQLLIELTQRGGSVIVFVKTKINADKIAHRLRGDNHLVEAIHGDLRHHKREQVIRAFHDRKCRVLIATDIAARGLDIPHIEHVINYDLPQCPEDYIHRIGRTARAGSTGEAICFVSPADRGKWSLISKLMKNEGGAAEQEYTSTGSGRPSRPSAHNQDSKRKFHAKPRQSSDRFPRQDSDGKRWGGRKDERDRKTTKPFSKPYRKKLGVAAAS